VGQWLPEPLPEPAEWTNGRLGITADPADRVTLDESISMAFLVVLESMTPAERVAFILHDVFGLPLRRHRRGHRPDPGGVPAAGLLGPPPPPRRPGPAAPTARQAGIVRAFSRPGTRKTSAPSSACSTPTPP
jgi:hypothetical protein